MIEIECWLRNEANESSFMKRMKRIWDEKEIFEYSVQQARVVCIYDCSTGLEIEYIQRRIKIEKIIRR